MATRPRIDLDGVSLSDESGPPMTLCSFRHRTTTGVVLALPESADLTVAWADIELTALDLKDGKLRILFTPSFTASQNWLRGARALVGTWTDRFVMTT